MADGTVTFTLPSGAKVTCSASLATRLGYSPPKPRKSESKSDTK